MFTIGKSVGLEVVVELTWVAKNSITGVANVSVMSVVCKGGGFIKVAPRHQIHKLFSLITFEEKINRLANCDEAWIFIS